MTTRLDLQTLLIVVLGSNNVYFQPPADKVMNYPCIVYKRDIIQADFADNIPYSHATRYMVTYIDHNPDSIVIDKLKMLPTCLHNRTYVTENLNHDVFNLFF